eukprot:GILK01009737.1.p1 GENE.GILK01009737.1~~GILK01009737.1.p1  ORF type:complete len:1156 (+),score=232.94 GILK01009737.1:179-3646(+)
MLPGGPSQSSRARTSASARKPVTTGSSTPFYGAAGDRMWPTPAAYPRTPGLPEGTDRRHKADVSASNVPALVVSRLQLSLDEPSARTRLLQSDNKTGWTWLVSAGKVLVWNMNSGQNATCYDLDLPPTGKTLDARLCGVFSATREEMPAVPGFMVVLPSGRVCVWTSIADRFDADAELPLEDSEVINMMILVEGQTFVCGTSKDRLFLIQLLILPGQDTMIESRLLRKTFGVLAGLGQSFGKLLGFGNRMRQGTATPSASIKALVATTSPAASGTFEIYAMTESTLERWEYDRTGTERFVRECPIHDMIRHELIQSLQDDQMQLKLVDVQIKRVHGAAECCAIVLAAVSYASSHGQKHLLCAFEIVLHRVSPTSVERFFRLHEEPRMSTNAFAESTFVRFDTSRIIVDSAGSMGLAFSVFQGKSLVIQFGIQTTNQNSVQELNRQGVILGGGFLDSKSSFFLISPYLGAEFLPVTRDRSTTAPAPSATAPAPIPVASVQNRPEGPKTEVALNAIQDGFGLYRSDKEMAAAERLLGLETCTDQEVNDATIEISYRIIDEQPGKGRRWTEGGNVNSDDQAGALLVQYQLEDKSHRHALFIKFLRDTNLWNALHHARFIIGEHSEKLASTLALRAYQNGQQRSQHSQGASDIEREVLSAAMYECVKARDMTAEALIASGLNVQDVFFSKVSHIEEILTFLQQGLIQKIQQRVELGSQGGLIRMVNEVFQVIIQTAIQHRGARAFSTNKNAALMSWTAAKTVRHVVKTQWQLTLEWIQVGPRPVDTTFLDHLLSMSDWVLGGYKEEVEIKALAKEDELSVEFELNKAELIAPFIQWSRLDMAFHLAEKYSHFDTLIELCESELMGSEGIIRLHHYLDQFSNDGFLEHVFRWYLKRRETVHKIFSIPSKFNSALQSFLTAYPHLAWIHELSMEQYEECADTLRNSAYTEKQLLTRKKTYLSLSKLAFKAADISTNDKTVEAIQDLDVHLWMVGTQERLAATFSDATAAMLHKPLTPFELISVVVKQPTASPMEKFQAAFEIYEETMTTPSLNQYANSPQAADTLKFVWVSCTSHELQTWIKLEQAYRLGQLSDSEMESALRGTVLHQMIVFNTDKHAGLTEDLMAAVLSEIGNENTHRIIRNTFVLAHRDAQNAHSMDQT